jgi:DNA mismatch endonuclease (patch repair protein)
VSDQTRDRLNLLPIHATQPKQNAEFWETKFARNQTRDRFVTRTLRRAGWRVLRIWDGARQRGDGRVEDAAP